MAGVKVDKMAVYEVPYSVEDYMIDGWQEYRKQLTDALGNDDRDRALELFMRLAGSSDADIEGAKYSEYWPDLREVAPTLAYDAECLKDGRVPDRLGTITQPVLVATGTMMAPGMQGLQPSFFADAAKLMVDKLQHGEYRELQGETHQVNPENFLSHFTISLIVECSAFAV